MSRAKEKKGNLSCFLCAWVVARRYLLCWVGVRAVFAHFRAGGCEEIQPEAADGKPLQSRECACRAAPGAAVALLRLCCGFQCGGHKGGAKLGHKMLRRRWEVGRNWFSRALWFAPVPVPGAIAEVPLPPARSSSSLEATWCCPTQSHLAQCSYWIFLLEGSTWSAWGEGRWQRRATCLCFQKRSWVSFHDTRGHGQHFWPGHGAQQHLRQGGQQMFANTELETSPDCSAPHQELQMDQWCRFSWT